MCREKNNADTFLFVLHCTGLQMPTGEFHLFPEERKQYTEISFVNQLEYAIPARKRRIDHQCAAVVRHTEAPLVCRDNHYYIIIIYRTCIESLVGEL